MAAELGAYPLLVQGEAPRERLLEAFRADVHSVLLATQSFWQGVDVRGEACSCVIIDRLPFAVPSDPLVAGRCEQIVRDGGSAFDDYALPQAALMLRQGFGRLLRSNDDHGVVAVLDGRLNTARYAEPLLAALAPVPRVHEIADVEAFFARSVELAHDLCWASVSKRKQEATRRNAGTQGCGGTPQASRVQAQQPEDSLLRRASRVRCVGALLVVAAIGVVLFATQRLRQRQDGRHEVADQERHLRRDRLHEEHGARAHDRSEDEGRVHAVRPADLRQALPVAAAADDLRRARSAVDPAARARTRQRPRAVRDKVSAADRAALRAAVLKHRSRTLMAPYPKLGKRVVYTAWQRMLSCQGFQEDALTGAQAKWAGMNGVAPERAAFNTPDSGVLPGTGW